MVDQQQFHDGTLIGHRLGRVGVDDLTILSRCLTGRHELGHGLQLAVIAWIGAPDLCETDSTVGDHGETRMPAVVRDLLFLFECHFKDGLSFLEVGRFAIDGDTGH